MPLADFWTRMKNHLPHASADNRWDIFISHETSVLGGDSDSVNILLSLSPLFCVNFVIRSISYPCNSPWQTHPSFNLLYSSFRLFVWSWDHVRAPTNQRSVQNWLQDVRVSFHRVFSCEQDILRWSVEIDYLKRETKFNEAGKKLVLLC